MPFDNEQETTVNVANLLLVADHIAHDPYSLDMAHFEPHPRASADCGTAMCIAGWAGRIAVDKGDFGRFVSQETPAIARDWLGLTQEQADMLFYIVPPDREALVHERGLAFEVTKSWHAIRAIRNLIETGDPQWATIHPEMDSDHFLNADEYDRMYTLAEEEV